MNSEKLNILFYRSIFLIIFILLISFTCVNAIDSSEQYISYSELVLFPSDSESELQVEVKNIVTDVKGNLDQSLSDELPAGRTSWAVTKKIGLSNTCEEGFCLMNIEGEILDVVANQTVYESYITPDGDFGVYVVDNDDSDNPEYSIYFYNIITKDTKVLINKLNSVEDLKISPDKKYISYLLESDNGESNSLYTLEINSGKRKNLTPGENIISDYSWSSDNAFLYFSLLNEVEQTLQVYRISPDGKGFSQIFSDTDLESLPIYLSQISPDGETLAMASILKNDTCILLYSQKKEENINVYFLDNENFIEEMYWSANGDFILIRIPQEDETVLNSDILIFDVNNKLNFQENRIHKIGEGLFPRWTPILNMTDTLLIPTIRPTLPDIPKTATTQSWTPSLNNEIPKLTSTATIATPIRPTQTPLPESDSTGGGNGKIIYQSKRNGSDAIYQVNLDGNYEKKISDGWFPSLDPYAEWIAYGTDHGLQLISTTGKERINGIDSGTVNLSVWSNDGQKIAYTGKNSNEISTISIFNKNNGKEETIIETPAEVTELIWSEEDNKIAYVGKEDINGTVFVYDLSTKKTTTIASGFSIEQWYESVCLNRTKNNDFLVTYGDGNRFSILYPNEKTILEPDMFIAYNPIWSPDMKQLVFVGLDSKFIYNLFVADADGNNLIQISSFTGNGSLNNLSWSPNGKNILFVSEQQEEIVYYVPADGGKKQKRVTFVNGDYSELIWGR